MRRGLGNQLCDLCTAPLHAHPLCTPRTLQVVSTALPESRNPEQVGPV